MMASTEAWVERSRSVSSIRRIKSPPFFWAASETAQDVAQVYAPKKVGGLPPHKFDEYTRTSTEYNALPSAPLDDRKLKYLIEVYVDDYIRMCVPYSREHLDHVSRSIQHVIHDIFPLDDNDGEEPTSLKKSIKEEGAWMLLKEILGWMFDGEEKTMALEKGRMMKLRMELKAML